MSEENGSQMAPVGGNTITPTIRINPSKNWCFTFNNYQNGSKIEDFCKILSSYGSYVFGCEVGESGTPHLQGYIEFSCKMRPSECKNIPKSIHWEKRKGTKEQAVSYCLKECGSNFYTNMKLRRKIIDPMEGKIFRDWQLKIINLIQKTCEQSDRRIHWFWEDVGNTGKSTFTKHIVMNYNACMVTGKGNDIKYIIAKYLEEKDLDIVIFDLPRISEGYLSYSALEEIKNGMICSGKYEGSSIIFNKPHVIVFANYEPVDQSVISTDRWCIHNIGESVADA